MTFFVGQKVFLVQGQWPGVIMAAKHGMWEVRYAEWDCIGTKAKRYKRKTQLFSDSQLAARNEDDFDPIIDHKTEEDL